MSAEWGWTETPTRIFLTGGEDLGPAGFIDISEIIACTIKRGHSTARYEVLFRNGSRIFVEEDTASMIQNELVEMSKRMSQCARSPYEKTT